MKKIMLSTLGVLVMVAASLAFYFLREPPSEEVVVDFEIADYGNGSYPVGSITNYVKNLDASFDPWGARYGGKAYQALLLQIDTSTAPQK